MQAVILPSEFYDRPVLEVARDLVGKRLVRQIGSESLSVWIYEVEAYDGETDLACHARSGLTPRTAPMYGPPGRAYVYFTYGMHWCLNAVAREEGYPAAVLIRAGWPEEGREIMGRNRKGRPEKEWLNGPAKLTRALEINGGQNVVNLCTREGSLWIEDGVPVPDDKLIKTPRIGINRTPEPWLSRPWRFVVEQPQEIFGVMPDKR